MCWSPPQDARGCHQMCLGSPQLCQALPRCARNPLRMRQGTHGGVWDPSQMCLGSLPDISGPPDVPGNPPDFGEGVGSGVSPPRPGATTGWAGPGDPQDVSPGGHIPAPGGRGELPPPFPSRNHPAAIPCRMRTPGGMKGWQGGGRGQCPRSQLATAATSKASGAATAAGVPRGGFEGPFMGAIRIYSPSRALGGGQRPP